MLCHVLATEEISNNEASGMDPLQRQVLEVGGALLQQMGITKKAIRESRRIAGIPTHQIDLKEWGNHHCRASQKDRCVRCCAEFRRCTAKADEAAHTM